MCVCVCVIRAIGVLCPIRYSHPVEQHAMHECLQIHPRQEIYQVNVCVCVCVCGTMCVHVYVCVCTQGFMYEEVLPLLSELSMEKEVRVLKSAEWEVRVAHAHAPATRQVSLCDALTNTRV